MLQHKVGDKATGVPIRQLRGCLSHHAYESYNTGVFHPNKRRRNQFSLFIFSTRDRPKVATPAPFAKPNPQNPLYCVLHMALC